MDREDIENKAQESLPMFGITFDPYEADLIRDGYYDGFIDGAEWMQEQMQEQMQAEIRHLKALVEAEKAIIGYKEDRLSELTEQLDAAHVFCEGVKEHYIKKARKWLENEYFNGKLREIDGSWFVFEDDFIKAMKGE